MPTLCAMDGCINNTQKGEFCFYHRPRKPLIAKRKYIKPESDKAHDRRIKARDMWFEDNPPQTPDGKWYCYLDGLSEQCWGVVDFDQILEFGLEHVIPKVKSRLLKFEVANLRASCPPCNKEKGSQTIDQLLMRYEYWGGPRS